MSKKKKSQEERPSIPHKATREFLKYIFSHDEIHEKGSELARLNSEAAKISDEKKSVTSSFKAQLDEKNAQIGVIGQHINNGYEHRYVECEIHYNDPNTGMKTIYRKDTGEVVKKETMTAEEMQLELELIQNGQGSSI